MEEYHFSLIRNIDAILIIITAFLSITIIIYAVINEWFVGIRYRRLSQIVSDLQKIAFKGNEAIVNEYAALIKHTTSLGLFRILSHKRNNPPGRFLKQFTECINNSAKITEIERIARKSISKWRRIEGIIMLGYLNSPNALGILNQALYNRDNDIAYFSLVSLGHIKNKESAKILLANINNKKFSSYKIASILEHFLPDIAEILIKSLEDQGENLRLWSIRLLSRFKPRECAKKVSDFITDSSADIRAAACECLGEIGAEGFEKPIQKCLNDNIWYVRLKAVIALEKTLGAKSITDIAPLLKDRHWFLREKVKEIMIKHFSESLVFIEKFLLEEKQDVKQSCVEIMDGSGYRDKILNDLVSGDIDTQDKAQLWLKAMIKAGAHFGLEGILSKYSPDMRQKILNAIAAVDKDKAEDIGKRLKGDGQ